MQKNILNINVLFSSFVKGLYILLFLLFIMFPIIVQIGASFDPNSVNFPPKGFTLLWYVEMFKHGGFIDSIRISFFLAFLAALLSTALAIPASLALTRYHFRGREVLNYIIVNSPLLVPGVLIGLALFQFFISLGIFGNFLTLVIAHVIITLPFPLRIICADLQAFNPFWEEASMIAGATKFQSFIKITLPLIKRSIFGGWLFAFIISWNDFPVAIFLSSAKTITFPVQMWGYLMYEFKPILFAISTTIIFFSGLIIIIVQQFFDIGDIYVRTK